MSSPNKHEQIMLTHDPFAEKMRQSMKVINIILTVFIVVLVFFTTITLYDSLIDSIEIVLDRGDNFFEAIDFIFSCMFLENLLLLFFTTCVFLATCIIPLIFESKCAMLDNTYRTALLTKEMAIVVSPDTTSETVADPTPSPIVEVPSSPTKAPDTQTSEATSIPDASPITEVDTLPEEAPEPEKNFKPIPIKDNPDLIICPQCGRKVFAEKTICSGCGCVFEK